MGTESGDEPGAARNTEVVASLRAAYDGAGDQWGEGPSRIYGPLADELVAVLPGPLAGRVALDAGAGGGAVSRALQQEGSRVVALDQSLPMLLAGSAHRPPAVVGDIQRVPLRSDCVDISAAAFVLSHVPSPEIALSELRRVTRRGGWVVASAFTTGARHPAKAAVDEVATRFGFHVPAWYHQFKESYEARVGNAAGLSAIAEAAGLADVAISETTVDLGHLSPTQLTAWRLEMPQLRTFITGLTPPERQRLVANARAALGDGMSLLLPALFLRSRSR